MGRLVFAMLVVFGLLRKPSPPSARWWRRRGKMMKHKAVYCEGSAVGLLAKAIKELDGAP